MADPRNARLDFAGLLAAVENASPVAAADVNLDRSITLGEFRQAAFERFQLLDTSHAGRLGLDQLKALLPPTKGRRVNRPIDAPDDRYGVPLPPSDSQPK